MSYACHPLSPPLRLFLSLTLALVFDWWVTIEWTWPDCGGGDQWLATYGLPFPYTRWGGASSMEYIWMPQIFVLNLTILTAMIFVALLWLPAFRHSSQVYGAVTVLATLNAVASLLVLSIMMVGNVPSLAHGEDSMFDLRPVAVHFDGYRRYECTPSTWWFPGGPSRTQRPLVQEPVGRFK